MIPAYLKTQQHNTHTMKENILKRKSYQFAIRIVRLSQYLQQERKEFVLSKQILRSGTAIGALIREAEYGQSIPDFIHKLNIALKETNASQCTINNEQFTIGSFRLNADRITDKTINAHKHLLLHGLHTQ